MRNTKLARLQKQDAVPNSPEMQEYYVQLKISDSPHYGIVARGTIETTDPVEGLEKAVKTFPNPQDIYSAKISGKDGKALAVYESGRCITDTMFPQGIGKLKAEGAYVNGVYHNCQCQRLVFQQPMIMRVQ